MSKFLPLLDPAETAACCSPLSAEPLSQAQAGRVAPLLKALADPVRLRLNREKRGVWVYYRARTEALASLAALIGVPRL